MLEDRDYMRASNYGSSRWQTATAIVLILNAVVFFIQVLKPSLVFDWHLRLSASGLKHGYVWQLLTFQFLHADIWHLLLNSIGLFAFGFAMEEALGKKRFVALYLASGVMGGLIHVLGQTVLPNAFGYGGVVGASAGLFGLIAAFALMAPERNLTVFLFMIFPITVSAKVLAGTFLGISLLGLILEITGIGRSSVAHGAHAGGMLGGWLMLQLYAWQNRRYVDPEATPEPPASKTETDFIAKKVDPILEKISKHGVHSLSAEEKKVLEEAQHRIGKR